MFYRFIVSNKLLYVLYFDLFVKHFYFRNLSHNLCFFLNDFKSPFLIHGLNKFLV